MIVWCWTTIILVSGSKLMVCVSLAGPWEYISSVGGPKTPRNWSYLSGTAVTHKKIECVLFLLLYKSWTNMTWILQQYIPILKAAGGFWSPFVQNIFCSMPRERNREENRWGEFFCSSCQLGESILLFHLAKYISP